MCVSLLMRTQFVVALHHNGAELKRILIRGLHVDQESWSATVDHTRLVVRRWLGLLLTAARVVKLLYARF